VFVTACATPVTGRGAIFLPRLFADTTWWAASAGQISPQHLRRGGDL